ncbi:HTH domain-containing protein [Halomicroarcula sp. GCM10025817]|uniref:HTH domain-containing protein n=1 Tax=Haloarcula TaxID=2237 RepID=UPI0023E790BD|nr:HTH domain-containing protein [Halomicroarcula sp. SYNS111]
MSNETTRSETPVEVDGRANDLEVALWTRRPVCGPRTTVIDRLSGLRSAGVLADFTVTTWPEEIVVGGRNRQSELLETIEVFEEWAEDHQLSLRPPFETRTASLLVGGSETVLTTPMMLAAAYEDGDIVGIYPCTDGSRTWTIPDLLDALEAPGDGAEALATSAALPPTESGTS